MIPFISRHTPTAAQRATVAEHFGELVCPDPIVFEPGRVVEQVAEQVDRLLGSPGYSPSYDPDDCSARQVAGVFPTWAVLELLNDGWTVVEFVNEPSARVRGAFVCRGAYVYEYLRADATEDRLRSTFLPCPIPPDQQEDSPLLAALR